MDGQQGAGVYSQRSSLGCGVFPGGGVGYRGVEGAHAGQGPDAGGDFGVPGVGVGSAAGGLVLVGDNVASLVTDSVEAFSVGRDIVGVVNDGGGDGVRGRHLADGHAQHVFQRGGEDLGGGGVLVCPAFLGHVDHVLNRLDPPSDGVNLSQLDPSKELDGLSNGPVRTEFSVPTLING